MELLLLVIIALLLLKPCDVQHILQCLARLRAWQRAWHNQTQTLFKQLEQQANELNKTPND